jgi:malate dehydrogenase (oxaloacetate-decarboxylating)
MQMEYFKESLSLHKTLKGKIETTNKMAVETKEDLSLVYSPGVAAPCLAIADNREEVYDYTLKGNTVAIVSDGSAVLGLGNIGPYAALPVMEGKAMLFKKFAGINGFPICLNTQDTEEIIATVRRMAPSFGGINLEDIAAPRCFEIENRLQDLGIPVFHDDQHGTAVVVLAGLINASKVVGKSISELSVVVNGAGAAGVAIARLLKGVGCLQEDEGVVVKDVIVCDTKGVIYKGRMDLTDDKEDLLRYTNVENKTGSVKDALVGADVFIGVSKGNLLHADDIATMADQAIIFALANPEPEIMPEEAYRGGAAVVATGRSDLPNQINNVLCFPGIFKGALEARASSITMSMKLAAAYAIAGAVENPAKEWIVPSALDASVALKVSEAVKEIALQTMLEMH